MLSTRPEAHQSLPAALPPQSLSAPPALADQATWQATERRTGLSWPSTSRWPSASRPPSFRSTGQEACNPNDPPVSRTDRRPSSQPDQMIVLLPFSQHEQTATNRLLAGQSCL